MKSALLKNLSPAPIPLSTQLGPDYACVAVIIRPEKTNPHHGFSVAYIRRAFNPKDAWSGQIAFPGGRRDATDQSDIQTATRETCEEVGWILDHHDHVGFLSDVQARHRQGWLPFFLRPVVFFCESPFATEKIDPDEVDEVFWISQSALVTPQKQIQIDIPDRGTQLPAIALPTGDKLWGLTYLITQELLNIIAEVA